MLGWNLSYESGESATDMSVPMAGIPWTRPCLRKGERMSGSCSMNTATAIMQRAVRDTPMVCEGAVLVAEKQGP